MRKNTSASVLGRPERGELYGVFRFILYVDKFVIYNGSGGSIDGMYIQPINVQPARRKDPNSARIISLLPPGASTLDAMKAFIANLVHEMTFGQVFIDAKFFWIASVYSATRPACMHSSMYLGSWE